jgi:hypothetical protein
VALNYLYAPEHNPPEGHWFFLPDVAASVPLTGKIPTIVGAFKIVPSGKLTGLKSVRLALAGEVLINPRTQDLFKTMIEERNSLAKKPGLSEQDRGRLDQALKVLTNATSYGISRR